jgi:hypothetical protein
MTAPVGTEVGIYVDLVATVAVGDVIETTSGRRYQVMAVRHQHRGIHAGRQHLRALVVPPNWTPDPMAVVHRIQWYRQAKRRR